MQKFCKVTTDVFNMEKVEHENHTFFMEVLSSGGDGYAGFILSPITGERFAPTFLDKTEILSIIEVGAAGIESQKYNGWANRETWALHLHLTYDVDLYTTARQVCKSLDFDGFKEWVKCIFDAVLDHERTITIRQELVSMVAEVGSLWRVDWEEVYNAMKID